MIRPYINQVFLSGCMSGCIIPQEECVSKHTMRPSGMFAFAIFSEKCLVRKDVTDST